MSEFPSNLPGPPWLPPAHERRRVDRRWLLTCLMLAAAALVFFGWRALLGVAVTGVCAAVLYALIAWGLRNVRWQLSVDSLWHAAALGLLMGLCLPVLTDLRLAVVTGAAIGVVAHWLGRTHRFRAHPVAVVMGALLLAGMLGAPGTWRVEPCLLDESGHVLRPNRLVLGDVADVNDGAAAEDARADDAVSATAMQRWWELSGEGGDSDALVRPTPAHQFAQHAHDYLREPGRFREALRSGRLLPISELAIGAAPGAVGGSSVLVLVIAGLWLMQQRIGRPGVALSAVLAAAAALMLLPVRDDGGWTWALALLSKMDLPTAITFVAYGLLALPLPLIVLVLAPDGQPISASGRVLYGVLLGGGAIAAVWWIKRPEAAFIALIAAGLIARLLDALRRETFRA